MIIMSKWRCDGFYDSFCDSFLIKGFQPCFFFCHYFISRLYIAIYGYHYLQYIARYSYSYSHRNFAFQSLVRTLVDTCWYYLVLMGVLFIQRWIPFFVCCPGNGLLTVCCVINGTRLSVVMGWILFSEEETPSLYSVFTTKQKAITERERERVKTNRCKQMVQSFDQITRWMFSSDNVRLLAILETHELPALIGIMYPVVHYLSRNVLCNLRNRCRPIPRLWFLSGILSGVWVNPPTPHMVFVFKWLLSRS